MKRTITIVLLCLTAALLLSGCRTVGETEVSVEPVSMITGMGYIGASDSYAGKVVSGETAEIKKASDKTILEVLVEEGDMVEAGDVLFTYDMEAMQLALDKLVIEKESYENTISSAENEISELQKQKKSASSSQQLNYTLQIDSRQADIREAEYNLALKEREIAAMEADMENTEITAPIAGRVMSVGSTDSGNTGGGMDYYDTDMGGGYGGQGTQDAFITIMDVSAYRVEGHINELNRGLLTEGMSVTVRSRTDDSQVWTGVIDSIDWEKPVQTGQSNYYGAADEMTTSSKYPFYVTLDDPEGLLLGQHVYISTDMGEESSAALALPSYYICDAEGDAWVWASSDKGKLEKRSVTLGAWDPDADTYEILGGVTLSDHLAFPAEDLREGMNTVIFDGYGYGEDMYGEDMYGEDMYGEDMYGEDIFGEDFYSGEMTDEDTSGEDFFREEIAEEELSEEEGPAEELDGDVSEKIAG